jgi:hypothetical protein
MGLLPLTLTMTQAPRDAVSCWIYRSSRKSEMYLYLPKEDDFDAVPQALMKGFGQPVRVMELTLHPQRPLAREDVTKVMENLQKQGFHLQMPPNLEPHLYHGEDI